MTQADRVLLGARWAERAKNELQTSHAFVEVARALREVGAPPDAVETALAAVEEERHHARLCSSLAEEYAASPISEPTAGPVARARFIGCTPRESSVLYVVMQCALGEGIAAGYLGRCLEQAHSELTRETLRVMLADEVRHARLGFRFIAGLGEADRTLVARALPELSKAVLDFWLDTRAYPVAVPPGHGCLDARELRAAVAEAWADLVLPGLEHVGIGVAGLREAVERY